MQSMKILLLGAPWQGKKNLKGTGQCLSRGSTREGPPSDPTSSGTPRHAYSRGKAARNREE
jgi:hypothetical protein